MRRAVPLVAVGAAVVLAAGCSGESEGQPEPAPVSSTSSSAAAPSTDGSAGDPDLPHSGAPKVSNPLPESVLAGDPCEALTRGQLKQALGSDVPDGERRDDERLGPRCSWDDDGGGFTLSFLTATRQGLSVTYSNVKDGGRTLIEVEPVHGLPAITLSDEEIACTAAVGLADEYAVSVNVTLGVGVDESADACEGALRVADMVVGNLKDKA